jgi:hypothetical protein
LIYPKEDNMRLSRPKNTTWWIAVILGVLGILSQFVSIPVLSGWSFWLVAAGFVLLALATYLKDL